MAEEKWNALFTKLLSQDDFDTWQELQRTADEYICSVQYLVKDTKEKLESVKAGIEIINDKTLMDCYGDFNAENTIWCVKELTDLGNTIRTDTRKFRDGVRRSYKNSVNKPKKILLVIGSMLAVVAVAERVLITAYGVPVIAPFLLGGEMAAEVTVFRTVCASVSMIAGSYLLNKNEVKAASNYLKNIENDILKIREGLSDIHASTKAFARMDRRDFSSDTIFIQDKIMENIEHCEKLYQICNEVVREKSFGLCP
eukprot:CAMPEP_0172490016 /NCGR_PEP_ID=MMETSP1066-20121228/20340_1 /TAXON_ID=671091 /ORGANISM="Coscinodiscus wailesii, Strain CCMP2513" /LENGTH=254 /DNA_ID=CAMNT_0013258285 /DNA_START=22 /DNA_END=786 /DNA_ORIENTATION=+